MGKIDQPVTRAYVAKVLVNMLAPNDQHSSCGVSDTYGWDNCSRYLRDNIGVTGSQVLDASKNCQVDTTGNCIMQYKPNSYITRDEMVGMLSLAITFAEDRVN